LFSVARPGRRADFGPGPLIAYGYHYSRNAETYLEVSLRLDGALTDLLKK
jgi:hypothetical protein